MPGESPLNMMRPAPGPVRHLSRHRRRIWPVLLSVAVIVLLAASWSCLWYYAAKVADRTLSGWVQREAAAGRNYSCGSQQITGFPLRIQAQCVSPAAEISSSGPPFAVSAQEVTFAAQVYHPTYLVGRVTSPLTFAATGQPPSFVANWSNAQIGVRGLPPVPESLSVTLENMQVDHIEDGSATASFKTGGATFDGRIVSGSPERNPVIRVILRFVAASAPTLHPLLAEPLQGEIQAELRGFKDMQPKQWAEHFREMQAAGGAIEIKSLRIDRSDATVVGSGTLTVNDHGKLDGQIGLAIAGIERIVPQLGLDKAITKSIDRLAGVASPSGQAPSALDRLMPGLGSIVRDTANANLIDNIKKMGQPTEIDKKPAVILPLRFADGSVYLGLLPLGEVPALF